MLIILPYQASCSYLSNNGDGDFERNCQAPRAILEASGLNMYLLVPQPDNFRLSALRQVDFSFLCSCIADGTTSARSTNHTERPEISEAHIPDPSTSSLHIQSQVPHLSAPATVTMPLLPGKMRFNSLIALARPMRTFLTFPLRCRSRG